MTENRAFGFLTPEYLGRWHKVQESFARITGLSVWAIYPDGNIIGRSSFPSKLCTLLRRNVTAREICNKDCIQNCQKALRTNLTVFFRCHAELHCFATPLRSSGKPVGVILGGQVLKGPPPLEKYKKLARQCRLPEAEVMKAVGQLTISTEKLLGMAAQFITEMAEAIFSGWESERSTSRKLNLVNNLLTLTAEFSTLMDEYELQALVLNSLAVLFDLNNAAIFMKSPHDGGMKASYALGPDHRKLMDMSITGDETFMETFLKHPEPYTSDDYYQILRAGFPDSAKQVTIFPLFSEESLQGILVIFNITLDDEEKKMIFFLIHHASLTIQNAFLRGDLKKNTAAMATFNRFNAKLIKAVNMDDLLSVLFEEASKLSTAKQASIMTVNQKNRQLMVKFAKGEKEEMLKNYSVPLGHGLAGKVAVLGKPLLVKDLEHDTRFKRSNRPHYRTPSFIIVPLIATGKTVGVLNVTDKMNDGAFNEDDLKVLQNLVSQSTVALERAEIYELSKELKKISITDPLTGLLNRRYFQERAMEEIERSRRFNQPLSLIMIDVDNFKYYNDRHGHPAGDVILKDVGSIIKSSVRNIDVVSRYGGEEFAVLSPNCDKPKSRHIAERIRISVKEHIFPKENEQPGGDLTISAGVATFPDDTSTLEELITNADKALYLSKKTGKNRATAFASTD